jgi:hypothetical protein
MSPAALEAVSRMGTVVDFYDQPVDLVSTRKTAAVFHTSSGVYLAVGPVVKYWHKHRTVGVEKRVDGRWCWVIESN